MVRATAVAAEAGLGEAAFGGQQEARDYRRLALPYTKLNGVNTVGRVWPEASSQAAEQPGGQGTGTRFRAGREGAKFLA